MQLPDIARAISCTDNKLFAAIHACITHTKIADIQQTINTVRIDNAVEEDIVLSL
jgi:hypothetical protein